MSCHPAETLGQSEAMAAPGRWRLKRILSGKDFTCHVMWRHSFFLRRCLRHILKFSLNCPIKSRQVASILFCLGICQVTISHDLIWLSWLWIYGYLSQIIFLMRLISWIIKWVSLSLVNQCWYLSQACGVPMNEIFVGKFRSMKFLLGNLDRWNFCWEI